MNLIPSCPRKWSIDTIENPQQCNAFDGSGFDWQTYRKTIARKANIIENANGFHFGGWGLRLL